ncbi:MAG: hypothetical protein AAF705_19290, partial [Bacteroidota bacterium]
MKIKNWLITALIFGVAPLFAQQASGCFELVDGGNGTIEVRFNVTEASAGSNSGAFNRMSRGEVTISWEGDGAIIGFSNGEYSWFDDGTTANSVQYRFGPPNQATTFNDGTSILLLTLNFSGEATTFNIISSDLINLLNQDLATDDSCPTSFELLALPVELHAFEAEVIKNSKVN